MSLLGAQGIPLRCSQSVTYGHPCLALESASHWSGDVVQVR